MSIKNISKAIYEHLITRRKYNTLAIRYETKKEELEQKIVELNTERRIWNKKLLVYETNNQVSENRIIAKDKQIAELQKELKDAKLELRRLKKGE